MNRVHLIPLTIVGLWLLVTSVAGLSVNLDKLSKRALAIGTCSKDYSPCTCTEQNVNCDQVPVRDIARMFKTMTQHDIKSIEITTSRTERQPIPDDFLGNVRVIGSINLVCTENNNLQVSKNAFRASTESNHVLTISGCNLHKLNFAFMSNMKELSNFYMDKSSGFSSFQGLPSHSNFKLMSITESSGFYSLDDTPVKLAGLDILYLNDNQLTDSEAAKLIKALASTSAHSLVEFRLYNNKLTRVPDFLSSLPNIAELSLNNNAITSLSANSLAFKGPISITLNNNQIKTVQPGAFGSLRTTGNFVIIMLNRNNFNQLDYNAFQTVLKEMALTGHGTVELGEVPIMCDCNLAWLLRDNRHLLAHVSFGQCSGESVDFADVGPERFDSCPAA
ncbi:slit homolog 1 protein-like isoform X3 [Daphnia pulicaria]|uniref:slit homolog 1 protein-like isoform X3 n=1 Tax=Daphnia pulicaria TaxID=35523 RepID=UPI001EEC4E2A|nr:slit homolog 1 protein-like isoform X3 [Daphnia pulicaria]